MSKAAQELAKAVKEKKVQKIQTVCGIPGCTRVIPWKKGDARRCDDHKKMSPAEVKKAGAKAELGKLLESKLPGKPAPKEVSTPKGKPVKEVTDPKAKALVRKQLIETIAKRPKKEASTPKGKPVQEKLSIRERDPRVPKNGTVLTGSYKGKDYKATVDAAGFIYRGKEYRSLSAIAREICGCAMNGFAFFGLNDKPKKSAAA
jgi:hypothetical protein